MTGGPHLSIVLLALAACDGVLREKPAGSDVDAGALEMVEPPPCDPPVTPETDGNHHPGEDCMMCHRQGGDGPPFTFAGTLFSSPGGAQPVAGAAIHLKDQLGAAVVVTTQGNGNFWSTELVTPPMLAFASLCPDVVPMLAPLHEGDGSCNRAGCHTSGFRLHVP